MADLSFISLRGGLSDSLLISNAAYGGFTSAVFLLTAVRIFNNSTFAFGQVFINSASTSIFVQRVDASNFAATGTTHVQDVFIM